MSKRSNLKCGAALTRFGSGAYMRAHNKNREQGNMIQFDENDLINIFNDVAADLQINVQDLKLQDIMMGIGMAGEAFGLAEGGDLVESIQNSDTPQDAINALKGIASVFGSGSDAVVQTVATINKLIAHLEP